MRLGFAGTPEFAATILRGLLTSEHEIALVLTQPDRPTGRGRKLKPSPVKTLAQASGVPVQEPISLKEFSLADERLDVLVVAAYGLILPDHILTAPRLGCLNVHASLLPRWRGAAPVERAIMAGDEETGVCLMKMEAGLDTGPVYACERTPIGTEETGGHLESRLAAAGAELLLVWLPGIESMVPEPQAESGITYADKLTARDTELDWHDDARSIARRVRALTDRRPVTVFGDAGKLRVRLLRAVADDETQAATPGTIPGTIIETGKTGIRVACGSGSLLIDRVQLNRGKGTPMAAADAARGRAQPFSPGQILHPTPPSQPPRS